MALTQVDQGLLGTYAQYTGFKNRLINSAMVIDQRNAGASVTFNDGVFPVDRWRSSCSQTSKATAQRSTTAPAGFINSTLITSSSAYSIVAGDIFSFEQMIEGFNIADLAWGTASASTVTLSFWVRSSLTGTFGGSLQNSARNRCYPFSYTISSANTFEQKTITIAGDTTGTWLTDNGIGIQVNFGLGVGSTYSGTAGAWTASNIWSATGATSVVGTSGATFYITGVQLEKGSTATSFDYRPYGTELQLCQRYCYVSSNNGVQYAPLGGLAPCKVVGSGTTTVTVNYYFPVTMRATPTLTSSALSLFGFYDFGFSVNPTTLTIDQANLNYAVVNYSGGSGGTVGTLGRVLANSTTTTLITLSAEL